MTSPYHQQPQPQPWPQQQYPPQQQFPSQQPYGSHQQYEPQQPYAQQQFQQPAPSSQPPAPRMPPANQIFWPQEGMPGVELFTPPKKVAGTLLLAWIPVLVLQFGVWTLLAALLPQFAGIKPPIVADYAIGAAATVIATFALYKKVQRGAMSTRMLVSPVGIETRDSLGYLNRIAWPDVHRIARVEAVASQGTIQGGGGKSFTVKAVKDMGIIGWGLRVLPANAPQALRNGHAQTPFDQQTGKHYISIPISLIDATWAVGRLGQLIQYYRPDLPWDLEAQETAVKTFKG